MIRNIRPKKNRITLDRIINKIKYDFFVRIFNNKLYKKNYVIYKTLILYSKKERRAWGLAFKQVSQRLSEDKQKDNFLDNNENCNLDSFEQSFNTLGIEIKDTQGNYKSAMETLNDLAKKWNSLSDES